MKATSMLNGMLQMLDLMGEDAVVSIRVQLPSGEKITVPLKGVKSGTQEEGIILTNED